jgi:DNA-binding transcriptional LysR family regulator
MDFARLLRQRAAVGMHDQCRRRNLGCFADGIEVKPSLLQPDASLSVNKMSLIIRAAEQGLGLGYVPERLAADQLQRGTLVKVLERFCPSYEPLHIYYPSHRLTPPKLKVFVELARKQFRQRASGPRR